MTQYYLSTNKLYYLIYDNISKKEKEYVEYTNHFGGYRKATFYRNNYDRENKITLCDMPGNPVVFILQSLYDRWNKKITLEDFKFIIDMAWVSGGKRTTFIHKYYGLLQALEANANELHK